LVLKTKLIVNLTRGQAVCVGELADGPLSRTVGLIGRRGLPAGEGLLLSPTPGIHTAFMRFPIDALFLDRDLRVLDVVERLRPWRMVSRHRARAVLELPAGESARRGVRIGDRLGLRERRPVAPETCEPIGQSWGEPEAASPDASGSQSESVIWPESLEQRPTATRLSPIRVLVVSPDRHFRSVTSMLLAHRGCSVSSSSKATRVAEMISRDRADVVVLDTGTSPATAQAVAAVGALAQPVGMVIVDESPGRDCRPPVLAKWGPFEDLFAAIERAGRLRSGASE
jgi:uncharacterized membrane protein (UPF0127 family)